jgi:intergrase/recombinase
MLGSAGWKLVNIVFLLGLLDPSRLDQQADPNTGKQLPSYTASYSRKAKGKTYNIYKIGCL